MIKLLTSASHLDYAIIGYFGTLNCVTRGDEVDIIITQSDYPQWFEILREAGFINRGAINLANSTYMFINLMTGIRIHIHLKFCVNIAKKEYFVSGSELLLSTKITCPIYKTYHVNRDWEEACLNISIFKKFKRLGVLKILIKDVAYSSKKYNQTKTHNQKGKISYILRAYKGYKNIKLFHPAPRFVHKAFHIAIIGCDGSGKSSTSKLLTKKLNQVTDAECVYFGINRGYVSFFLKKIAGSFGPNWLNISIVYNFILAMYWLNIARIRLKIYRRCREQNLRGMITVSDRYPLDFFWNMQTPMDGPRIDTLSLPTVIKNIMSNLESNIYKSIHKPKVIFLLHAPLGILQQRHSDSLENLENKYNAVHQLYDLGLYKSFDTSSEQQSDIVDRMLAIIQKNLYD